MFDKRILNLVPGSKKYIAAAVFLNWVCLLANIAIMLSFCFLFSSTFSGERSFTSILIQMVPILIIGGIIRVIATTLSTRISANASQNVKSVFREKVFRKLIQLGPSYHQMVSTAEAVQVGIEGINQLEIYFGQYMPQLFYSFLAPLTLFVVLAPISLKAAIALLICVPLIPISIMAVQRFAKKLLNKYWNSYTELGDTFLENIQGLTTLKIYQADEMKHEEMNKNSENFRKITMRVLFMQLNSISVMDLVAYGGAAAGIILSVWEFSLGNVSLFGALAILLLSAEFFLPLRLLGSFFHIAMNGIAAAGKMFHIFDLPVSEEKTAIPNDKAKITFKNVCFTYADGKPVLKGLSFKIPRNSLIGLVGKSGCGKSTIAGLLTGLLSGYEGSISIGDCQLRQISEEGLMQYITRINHNSYIFKGTVAYNLRLAKEDATEQEMIHVLKAVNLYSFLWENDGLSTELEEQGANLSGGQRQRLALARALLYDTPVYVFDEATSSIDVESEEIIMNVVRRLAKEKTVLLISHRLANVISADQILVLNQGRIAESGTFNQLMQRTGFFQELYTAQRDLENFGREEEFSCQKKTV